MANKVVEHIGTECLEHDSQESPKQMTECLMESMEQNTRRDCILFCGLNEDPREETALKIVETARAVGIDLEQENLYISNRLRKMNRNLVNREQSWQCF